MRLSACYTNRNPVKHAYLALRRKLGNILIALEFPIGIIRANRLSYISDDETNAQEAGDSENAVRDACESGRILISGVGGGNMKS